VVDTAARELEGQTHAGGTRARTPKLDPEIAGAATKRHEGAVEAAHDRIARIEKELERF
jgi:hypothetical protein